MSHAYDLWGWYTGEVAAGSDRSTDATPPKCRVGERPNWTGHKWICQPYREPPVAQEARQSPVEIIDEAMEKLAKLKEALK